MQQPLVSVIVPNYNYATFLPERLTSILEQTYRNIEVLLLDDCSTDTSVSILQQYQQHDQRVRPVCISTSNSGSPYHQWSKGIQMAKGQYIWIAEADDTADLSLVEKAVEALQQHPNAVFAQVDSYLTDDNGNILDMDIDHWKRNHIVPSSISITNGNTFVRKQMYWKNRIYNASGVVVRTSCITPQVLEKMIIPHISDWIFWSAIAIQGDIIQIHQRLNRFRQHATSLTHSAIAHHQSAQNEAQVVALLQQMVHIPYILRIRRTFKIYTRNHVLRNHNWSALISIAQLVLCQTNKMMQKN